MIAVTSLDNQLYNHNHEWAQEYLEAFEATTLLALQAYFLDVIDRMARVMRNSSKPSTSCKATIKNKAVNTNKVALYVKDL